MLSRHLASVRQRIRAACERVGRDPASITVVGVTKTVPVEIIREAVQLGLADLGENRMQEAREKIQALTAHRPSVRWHFIGHLQRNKAKLAVELFDVIHSVDSLELIRELERHAAAVARVIPVLLQINVSGEATKSGCQMNEVPLLVEALKGCRNLTLNGFMTIPPLSENPEAVRAHFSALRQLRDQTAVTYGRDPSNLHLSMGMSHDFEVAIEEGADIVRIGTAIFGARSA